LPRLQEIWKTYEDRGLSVVAIQSNQDLERGRRMVEEMGLPFHVLHTEADIGVVWHLFASEGNPSNFLVDREGRILSYHPGYSEGDEVEYEKQITQLLATPDPCG
jgi:glutathione peroxidase-family protein